MSMYECGYVSVCVCIGEHAKCYTHTHHERRQTATQRIGENNTKKKRKRKMGGKRKRNWKKRTLENRRSKMKRNVRRAMSACHHERVCACLCMSVHASPRACECVSRMHELQLLLKAFACHSFALCAPVLALSTRHTILPSPSLALHGPATPPLRSVFLLALVFNAAFLYA